MLQKLQMIRWGQAASKHRSYPAFCVLSAAEVYMGRASGVKDLVFRLVSRALLPSLLSENPVSANITATTPTLSIRVTSQPQNR